MIDQKDGVAPENVPPGAWRHVGVAAPGRDGAGVHRDCENGRQGKCRLGFVYLPNGVAMNDAVNYLDAEGGRAPTSSSRPSWARCRPSAIR